MPVRALLLIGFLMTACGGSNSETPQPLEPHRQNLRYLGVMSAAPPKASAAPAAAPEPEPAPPTLQPN